MNTEENRLILTQKRDNLHGEVIAIQNEADILQALLKKAEQELTEVQTKLSELEESNVIKLAYAS